MSFLEHIRTKPPQIRKQYAFGVAMTVTSLVGVVWMTTLPAQFSQTAQNLEDEVSTLTTLGESMGDVTKQIANVIGSDIEDVAQIPTTNMDAINIESVQAPYAVGVRDISLEMQTSSTTEERQVLPPQGDVRVYTTPEPKVILIGTTTKNISE